MEPVTLRRRSESSPAGFGFYKIVIESASSCLICTERFWTRSAKVGFSRMSENVQLCQQV